MASKKFPHEKPANYLFSSNENSQLISTHSFEFDESDLWSNSNVTTIDTKNMISPSCTVPNIVRVNKTDYHNHYNHTCGSLPLNIPDWSRIYNSSVNGGANPGNHGVGYDYEEDGENDEDGHDQEGRVPPHEYLARRRGASFSVHEGIGRTLKGRDLCQVRNAIWKKVGFED